MSKEKIKLVRLELENFVPFYGEKNIVEFAHDHLKRNVTLVEGIVGAGKTSIFQGMYWIVYGDEWRIPGKKDKDRVYQLKFLKNNAFFEAINAVAKNTQDEIRVGGKLTLHLIKDEKPTEYLVSRYYTYRRDDSGKLSFINEKFQIFKEGEVLIGDDYSKFYVLLRDILFDPDVRDFVFIHGESLSKKLENIENVKNFSLNLSDQPNIQRVRFTLSKFDAHVQKKLKNEQKNDAKLNRYNDELEILKEKESKKNEQAAKLSEDIDRGNLFYQQQMKELKQLGEADKEAERLNDLYERKRKLEMISTELEKERSNALSKNLNYIFLEKAMQACRIDLNEKKDAGIYPQLISKEVVEQILALNTCIGIPWTNENKELVNSFMKSLPTGELSDIFRDFDNKLDYELNRLHNRKMEIVKAQNNYIKNRLEITEIGSVISEIGMEAETHEERMERNQAIKDLQDEVGEISRQIGSKENERKNIMGKEIPEIQKEIKKVEAKIKKHVTMSKKTFHWQPVKEQINALVKVFENIDYEFSNRLIKKVQKVTDDVFKELVPHPEQWHEIEIINRKNGWELAAMMDIGFSKTARITSTSTGQSQLLSLAYSIALNNLLDVSMPLIFDSPFVQLSIEEKKKLAKSLPAYYEGRQIILFVKDAELRDTEEDLMEWIGKRYKLNYNKTDKKAEIIPIGIQII